SRFPSGVHTGKPLFPPDVTRDSALRERSYIHTSPSSAMSHWEGPIHTDNRWPLGAKRGSWYGRAGEGRGSSDPLRSTHVNVASGKPPGGKYASDPIFDTLTRGPVVNTCTRSTIGRGEPTTSSRSRLKGTASTLLPRVKTRKSFAN